MEIDRRIRGNLLKIVPALGLGLGFAFCGAPDHTDDRIPEPNFVVTSPAFQLKNDLVIPLTSLSVLSVDDLLRLNKSISKTRPQAEHDKQYLSELLSEIQSPDFDEAAFWERKVSYFKIYALVRNLTNIYCNPDYINPDAKPQIGLTILKLFSRVREQATNPNLKPIIRETAARVVSEMEINVEVTTEGLARGLYCPSSKR